MAPIHAFGPFHLDVEAQILFRGAEPLPVGRRGVALLRALVERPGVPVSKDALIEAAWPGLAIEDSNLTVQIAALRKVLGEEPGGDHWIETLPRRGYRFVGPVTTSDKPVASTRVGQVPLVPDKPSIAVLPFKNMSGDLEQEYFADGMVEDIITALSRIKWLFVTARTSTFTYKGKAIGVTQIGRELGVRYVLEGSVRKARDTVRITAQLIDAATGAHLWADRFDGSLDDVFELQERVAISVAGVIEPALVAAEIVRSTERPTNDPTAYDFYLRAFAQMLTWRQEAIAAALGLLDKAIERDPNYGPALVRSALCHAQLHANGWSKDQDGSRDRGIDLARRALGVAAEDPFVLATAAYVLAYFGEDIDAAMALVDRALTLNPSSARGWMISGWLHLWAGQPEAAIGHIENSLRLDPLTRTGGPFMTIGVAHFFARRFEEARTMLLRSLQEHPSWAPTYRFLASCYAHMGLLDQARETVQKLRALTPEVVPAADHWRKPELRHFFWRDCAWPPARKYLHHPNLGSVASLAR
jgi:adenylate cyclase